MVLHKCVWSFHGRWSSALSYRWKSYQWKSATSNVYVAQPVTDLSATAAPEPDLGVDWSTSRADPLTFMVLRPKTRCLGFGALLRIFTTTHQYAMLEV
ncbi:hypothetical protein HJFPF1_04496 [Paramyrothecium foliicola]|nr:hypothetical protein HJFPF1_04496 [Paramyrothecium foliicola]